jgi:single-stranded-DNA-specific exonuclease
MTPLFLTKELKDTGFGKPIGTDNEHLKLFVKQHDSQGFAAIGFGLSSKIALTQNNQLFQAVYSIDENQWNGQTTLQLRLRDVKEL